MLSRVADSLYWMSRYLERAEHAARLIDVDLTLGLDQPPLVGSERWRRLCEALQAPESLLETADLESLTHALTLSRSNPSSIFSCVAAARENLRHVRDQCSSKMWETLNCLYLQSIDIPQKQTSILELHGFCQSVQEGGCLFQGISDSNMTHGEGWHYVQLGRFIERIDTVAALLGSQFKRLAEPPDQTVRGAAYSEWVGLLRSSDAFEIYCKVYSAKVRPLRVAELLLLNPGFPHSLCFSAEMIHTSLRFVENVTKRNAKLPARTAGRLRRTLRLARIEKIADDGIQNYLNSVRSQCDQAHSALAQTYFDCPVESTFAA